MKLSPACKGFTLIELLTSLLVIGIILGIGLPAFSNVIETSKRKDTVYQLMAMLNFARDTAVSNSENVVICPSINGIGCEKTRNWSLDLLVFIDRDKNNELDEDDTLLRSFEALETNQSLSWKSFQNKSWLSFHADGSSGFQSGRLYYCYDGGLEPNDKAQVIVYRTKRSRIATQKEFNAGC